MDILFLGILIATGIFVLNAKQQRQRIVLLASYLGHYQIEKLMENLTEGYLRALGESDPERREQVWSLLRTTELQLSEQFTRFAAEFARVEPAQARVSTLALALPFADQWLPRATFDMRQALQVHAQGIERAVRKLFPMTPKGIIDTLKLRRPIYRQTAAYGHFGRTEKGFEWEKTDKAQALREEVAGLPGDLAVQ